MKKEHPRMRLSGLRREPEPGIDPRPVNGKTSDAVKTFLKQKDTAAKGNPLEESCLPLVNQEKTRPMVTPEAKRANHPRAKGNLRRGKTDPPDTL